MAEKVLEKIKRLSRDLADSVRSELDLKDHIEKMHNELTHLKKCVSCYVHHKEGINDADESIAFVKGFYEAKSKENKDQMKFGFVGKK